MLWRYDEACLLDSRRRNSSGSTVDRSTNVAPMLDFLRRYLWPAETYPAPASAPRQGATEDSNPTFSPTPSESAPGPAPMPPGILHPLPKNTGPLWKTAPAPAPAPISSTLTCPPAKEQARQFMSWLKRRYGGQDVFQHRLKNQLYPIFCREKGWRGRPWNELAKHLRQLTGGKRTYQWVEVDGALHRWRTYHIPAAQMPGPPKPKGKGRRRLIRARRDQEASP